MSVVSRPDNILLVGFMGAGKSTVGRELARLCGYSLLDLDEEIIRREGRSIPEIFATEGEAHFRRRETAALLSLAQDVRRVIATGGGIVGREENWKLMRRMGAVVYLRVDWETLLWRLRSEQGRPLGDGQEDWQKVESLWRSPTAAL